MHSTLQKVLCGSKRTVYRLVQNSAWGKTRGSDFAVFIPDLCWVFSFDVTIIKEYVCMIKKLELANLQLTLIWHWTGPKTRLSIDILKLYADVLRLKVNFDKTSLAVWFGSLIVKYCHVKRFE